MEKPNMPNVKKYQYIGENGHAKALSGPDSTVKFEQVTDRKLDRLMNGKFAEVWGQEFELIEKTKSATPATKGAKAADKK